MGLVPVDTTRFEMPPPGSEAHVGTRFRRYETVAAWVVALNDFLRRGLVTLPLPLTLPLTLTSVPRDCSKLKCTHESNVW